MRSAIVACIDAELAPADLAVLCCHFPQARPQGSDPKHSNQRKFSHDTAKLPIQKQLTTFAGKQLGTSIIAVASGKGGVGKSTVSTNLALA